MTLRERIEAQFADINAQIENERKRSAEKIDALIARRQVLRQAAQIITPELEEIFRQLQKIGLIDAL